VVNIRLHSSLQFPDPRAAAPAPHCGNAAGPAREEPRPTPPPAAAGSVARQSLGGAAAAEVPRVCDPVRRRRRPHGCVKDGDAGEGGQGSRRSTAAAVEGSGGACVAPGSDPCVADLMKAGAMATGLIWIQLGLVWSAWFLYLHRQIRHCQQTRGDFWVYPASRGHLELKSRAWWWWLTLHRSWSAGRLKVADLGFLLCEDGDLPKADPS
jgi:hypothetical protein